MTVKDNEGREQYQNCIVLVSGLPSNSDLDELEELIGRFGLVEDLDMYETMDSSGEIRTYCEVTFDKKESAELLCAQESLVFKQSRLTCHLFEEMDPENDRDSPDQILPSILATNFLSTKNESEESWHRWHLEQNFLHLETAFLSLESSSKFVGGESFKEMLRKISARKNNLRKNEEKKLESLVDLAKNFKSHSLIKSREYPRH